MLAGTILNVLGLYCDVYVLFVLSCDVCQMLYYERKLWDLMHVCMSYALGYFSIVLC